MILSGVVFSAPHLNLAEGSYLLSVAITDRDFRTTYDHWDRRIEFTQATMSQPGMRPGAVGDEAMEVDSTPAGSATRGSRDAPESQRMS